MIRIYYVFIDTENNRDARGNKPANNEEGIKVGIHMRPLNNKENTAKSQSSSSASRVWHVLSKCNLVV